LPAFEELDVLNFLLSRGTARYKEIEEHICDKLKITRQQYSKRNIIKVQLARMLQRFVKHEIAEKDSRAHKEVYYSSTPTTKEEVLRLTFGRSKFHVCGYAAFSIINDKPIIAIEPQDEKMNPKLVELIKQRDQKSHEIGDVLLSVVRFYIMDLLSEEPTFSADYYKTQKKVFYVGNFSEEISSQMKEAVQLGVFKDYTHIFKQIVTVAEQWSRMWEEFKQGRESIAFPSGRKFRYDLEKQKVVKVS
jgi:hypothetical protein